MDDQVMQALKEQLACYQRLFKLAQIQHEHVLNSQTEALLEVLAQRQMVLDQVSVLDQTIVPAQKQWAIYLGGLSSDLRAMAEKLVLETKSLLGEITNSDRNDALILQQRKLNLGKQISQTTMARQVNRTYAAAAYGKKPSRMDVTQ